MDITSPSPKKTSVVRLRAKQTGEIVQGCEVYIGRKVNRKPWNELIKEDSIWANPFKGGDPGDNVYKYYKWIQEPQQAWLLARIGELRGQQLGCWCVEKGYEPCHGWVLAYFADGIMSPVLKNIIQTREHTLGGMTIEQKRATITPIIANNPPRVELDRVKGGFIAMALGDALGVPHEFSQTNQYTGRLQYRLKYLRQFQPPLILGLGQYSDDTEMAIALARALIEGKGWNRKMVIRAYIDWANSNMPLMGKHTRELFKDKTYDKYVNTYQNLYGAEPGEILYNSFGESSQSNGSLMRCFPLGCLWNANAPENDAALTNPSSVNTYINSFYVNLLRLALTGRPAKEVWEYAKNSANIHPEIQKVVSAVINSQNWNLSGSNKGWVVFSLYASMVCLSNLASDNPSNYNQLMYWVIGMHPSSDTDTNACIAGGLIGSLIGWDKLNEDELFRENINVMFNMRETELQRPQAYRLDDFEQICTQLTLLSGL